MQRVPTGAGVGRFSLRLRLVGGLVVLAAVGLGAFGLAATILYGDSQFRQLDQQLQAAVPFVASELATKAGVALGGPGPGVGPGTGATGGQPGAGGPAVGPPPGAASSGSRPPVVVAPGTFGELIGPRGRVVSHIAVEGSAAEPALPAAMVREPGLHRTGSVRGSVGWEVDVGRRTPGGYVVVVAVPTTTVVASVHRLELIEVAGGLALLVALSTGAGLMLRRGLAPLERMAGTARRIAAGQLTDRVTVTGGSEVATLGAAFNTMLDQIQAAFAARDATEERLRQFLADASHELRTPLTSIRGFAALLRLGAADSPEQRASAVDRIESEAVRMAGLVEDLLLLARLDRPRPAEQGPVDLAVLAADACGDARAAAPGRPVTLHAPEPVVVEGDEAHLRQAVGNLLANALRHTPAGTPVEVTVSGGDDEAVLTVRDHGPGLDDEALTHAFDRFWRGDPARAGQGAGLGLAIVAGVLREHGGTVEAANAPDGGAVFRLRLPRSRPSAAAGQLAGNRRL